MGHDHDGKLTAQFGDQIFNFERCNRVKGRAWLVHQHHLGRGRNCPCNAEALLLSTGEGGTRAAQAILHFVPEGGPPQGPLNPFADTATIALTEHTQPIGYIIEDRLGKGIGALEDHAHASAQHDRIDLGAIDGLTVNGHDTLGTDPGGFVVHPVDRPEQGRLTAAGGPDQRRHFTLGNGHGDGVECFEAAIVEVKVARLNLGGSHSGLCTATGAGRGSRSKATRKGKASDLHITHGLAHLSTNVLLGAPIARLGEDLLC